jgi:hypothetical protein
MAGAKVYDALLGAESWINFDGPDGSDLCLCFPDWDPDTAPLPTKPEAHGIMCSHFRDAIYSWRSISTAGRALAARVSLLEATVQVARGLRWVHPLDRGRYEAKFDVALATLDSQEPK